MITVEMIKQIQEKKGCSLVEAKRILDKKELIIEITQAQTIEKLKIILIKFIDWI